MSGVSRACAAMGVICWKETFREANEALHCLLLLDTLVSYCCRENGAKEKLHFTDNVPLGFLRETKGQSSQSQPFFVGSFEARMYKPEERDFVHI